MNALKSPIAVIFIATFSGVGTGLAWYWQAAQTIITAIEVKAAEELEEARPEEPWDFWTVELENITREITDQRQVLALRSQQLDERERLLDQEREEIEASRRQVEALQNRINQHIVAVQEEEQRNLKSLAETYSQLSARAAVAIFNELDDTTVAKLLSFMPPESAAEILEELSTTGGANPANVKRAAELSQRLRLLLPHRTS